MFLSLLNSQYIILFICLTLLIFLILILWKKIISNESFTYIIDKKINMLNKEIVEIRKYIKETETFKDYNKQNADVSDIIMNEVFNDFCNTKNSFCNNLNYNKKNIQEPIQDIQDIQDIQEDNNSIQEKQDNKIEIIIDDDKKNKTDIDIIDSMIDDTNESIAASSDFSSNNKSNSIYNRKKLTKMNVEKIKEICISLNLSIDGTKTQLIDRILNE